eukprot:698649-Alexandrium_andersonii.AAC.1
MACSTCWRWHLFSACSGWPRPALDAARCLAGGPSAPRTTPTAASGMQDAPGGGGVGCGVPSEAASPCGARLRKALELETVSSPGLSCDGALRGRRAVRADHPGSRVWMEGSKGMVAVSQGYMGANKWEPALPAVSCACSWGCHPTLLPRVGHRPSGPPNWCFRCAPEALARGVSWGGQ